MSTVSAIRTASVSTGALSLDVLVVVLQPAQRQANADDAGAHDHHGRKHGFARQRRVVLAMQHHRDDHRCLDDRDGKGQQQRAVGLADPPCDGLGVMQDDEHRCEDEAGDREQRQRPWPRTANARPDAGRTGRLPPARASRSGTGTGRLFADSKPSRPLPCHPLFRDLSIMGAERSPRRGPATLLTKRH